MIDNQIKIMVSDMWNEVKVDEEIRRTIIEDYDQGGLKMIHIPSLLSGLKIAWIKHLLDENNI